MEPKTIEEYRDYVKDLKLQLRKAEKKNVELIVRMTDKTKAQDKEKKGTDIEESINLTKRAIRIQAIWRGYRQRQIFKQELRKIAKSDPKAGVKINTNNTAMAEISTAVKRIGLNLEMLFRSCDTEGRGEVTLEDFRLFIKRLGLKKVSQAQINRFLHAIDEDCTGIISKEEYHNCLAAYSVASEGKGRSSNRTFEQECILKFASVLRARDVKPEEVYNFCDTKQTGVVTAAQLAKFISNLSERFQEKEIHGIIQYLDVDGDKKIPKDFFLKELNKAGELSERPGYQSPDKSRSPDSYNAKPIKLASFGDDIANERNKQGGTKKLDTPKFEERGSTRVIKPIATVKKPVVRDVPRPGATTKNEGDQETKNLKRMIVKLELAGKPIYQFFENFLLGMKDPKGVSGNDVLKLLEKDYPQELNRQEKIALVKAMDHNVNGTIDVKETEQFFLTMARESKEKIISAKLLQITIAKTLDAEAKATEDYLKAIGIQAAQRMKLQDFQNKLRVVFDLDQERADEIFKDFEDRGTGTVDVAQFIKTVNSYRGTQVSQGAGGAGGAGKAETKPEKPTNLSINRPEKIEVGDVEMKNLKRIIVKMELNSKPIYEFLERFLLSVKDPAKGVTAAEFSKMLDKDYGDVISKAEKTTLVKALDQNVNGTIDIFEVKQFFLTMAKESKERIVSTRLLLISIAKSLDLEKQSTEDFLKSHGIKSTQRCTLQEFHAKLKGALDLEDKEANEIFMELDDRGTGTIDIAHLIETINSFRGDQSTAAAAGQTAKTQTPPKSSAGGKVAAATKVLSLPTNIQGLMETHVKKVVEKEPQKETKDFKKAITKLELNEKPIYDLMLLLLKEMYDPKAGLPVNHARELWKKEAGKAISEKELETVLGKIDVKQEGNIDVEDLLAFVNSNAAVTKERLLSSELLIAFMAKEAQATPVATVKYLENFGIYLKSRLRLQEFIDRLDDLVTVPEEYEPAIFGSFNHNNSGYVEIDNLVNNINNYRSDLTEKGKISYKLAVETLLQNEIYKVIVDDTKEKTEKEARLANEQALELFKNMLREKGIKPMEFFDNAANGDSSCNVMSLRMAIQRTGIKMNPQDLTKVLKLLDTNGNGTIELHDYEMAIMDEEGLKIFQAKARGERDTDAIDEEVVNKVKGILTEMDVANTQLFKESDAKQAKVINLLQLREGVKRMIPYSKLTFAESVKFLRSMDIHYTGLIKEDDFNFVMNRTKPGANLTRVIKSSSDARAEIKSPAKIQAVGAGGGAKDDDLKDAIQKLKTVLFNPKVNLKPDQIFKKFDLNNDKVITREEFLQAVDTFDSKINISERQKVLLVTLADKNRDNKIDYNEFLELLKQVNADTSSGSFTMDFNNDPRNPATGATDIDVKGQSQPGSGTAEFDKLIVKLRKYAKDNQNSFESFEYNFRKLDSDKNDLLNRKEFFLALDRMKLSLTNEEKEIIYRVADTNGDGLIHLNEFFDFFQTYEVDLGAPQQTRQASRRSDRERSVTPTNADVITAVEIEATDKAFEEYMSTINIKEEDYFRPDTRTTHKSTTIMNNMVVALKRCHEIVKQLEKNGKTLWDDPDFGPQKPGDHAESSMYVNERPPGYPEPTDIQWFRPSEIVTDQKTVFMDKEADTNDVIQGQIGDCWLIGGFSLLATQPKYIKGGFDPSPELIKQLKDKELSDEEAEQMQFGLWCPVFHYLRKYGIYVIRFFKNFSWRYVIMDDKLPCYKYEDDDAAPTLCFGKCRNHYEFWVPLLEKAYAKLHTCYETIVAGYIDDGLTDMTGLVSNKYKLQGPKGFPGPQVGSAEELWQKLLYYRSSYTMMGCSIQGVQGETEKEVTIDGEPVGLLKNHAYAILDILELPNPNARNAHKSHRLLRIRNPWGTKEWNGEWSDGSTKLLVNLAKLNSYIKEKARRGKIEPFDPEANDGTFLMSFKDWREIFHNLFCCVDFPDEWSGIRFTDNWTKENSGGTPLKPDQQNIKEWAKNPQFVMNLNNKKNKTTKMLISLGQNDGRLLRELKFPYKENINPAVFSVCTLKAGEKRIEVFDGARIKKLSALKEYREISIEIELENGNYVIVPSTGSAGQTGLFVLNVYFECEKSDINLTKSGSTLKGEFIQEEEETPLHYDKELKKILKIKLLALLCEDELEASLNKSQKKTGASQDKIESLLEMSQSSMRKKGKSTSQMQTSKTKVVKEDWDPQQANKIFNDLMNRKMLEDKDFFRPDSTTILNSEMAALKQCHEILKGMKRQGKKFFVDPDFGPKSGDDPGLEFLCDEPEDPPIWVPSETDAIKWIRLKDICPTDKYPYFLSNGAESGDVLQGQLGDCWFISALSVLANDDRYIKGSFRPTKENMREISDEEAKGMTSGVYPPIFHWLRQFGIYVLRFYKNYEWRYVIVDDRIPCMKYPERDPEIIFAKCLAKDEFWVPLIEKAYAKIHYTYEALAKGAIDDGLSDMTALVSEKSKIQDRSGKTPEVRDAFWSFLMEQNKNGTLMGCSIKANPGETEQELIVDETRMGILKGHAYSILDVFELLNPESEKDRQTHRLLRIRNPWGNKEWSGKWSDGSDHFATNIHKIEKYMREEKQRDPEYEILDTKATDDGTFLMCYKDWRTYFNNLFICLDWPSEWSGLRFEDEWTKDNSGGFPTAKDLTTWAKNPQYLLQIDEKTDCFLSLGQKDGRLEKGQKFPYPGLVHCIMAIVLKLNPGEERDGLKSYDHARILGSTPAKEYRETSLFIDDLAPGKYLVVPCTKNPRSVGKFFVDFYFGCPKNKVKFTKIGSTTVKAEVIEAEEETAQQYDDDFKLVLKAKAAEVIDGEEKQLLEKTLSFIE